MRTRFSTKVTLKGIGVLVAACLLASPLAAQEEAGFADVIDVRVVNVEVVVTKDGERVSGLESDDFRLLVDGQEMPIEYFTEVRDGRAAAAPDLSLAMPAAEPGSAVGTYFLVFVDDYFAIPSDRNRVLRELSEQLTLLGPDDRMAIVAFDGQRVEMLSSWTRSVPELEDALERAARRRAYGLQRLGERNRFETFARFDGGFTRFARFGPGFYDPTGYEYWRGEEVHLQVERVLDGATSALRAFARPPGRKVMLLLSGGWPAPSLAWYGGYLAPSTGYAGLDDRRLFSPLVDTANRLGYSLYPVDVSRTHTSSYGSAQHATLEEAVFADALEQEYDRSEDLALYRLADATGGRAFIDGSSLNALEGAVEDTRSYYWLGFTPAWREDDRRHRVEVEVLGKGYKVRSRKSFSDLSRESEVTMMVESAQLFDLPLPGQGELAVTFGEAEKAGYKKVVVPVKIAVPLDRLDVIPHGDGYAARFELRVAVTDADGDRAEIPVIPVELHTDDAPAAGEVGVYETKLKLRRKPHRLLVSLHDPASGAVLSKRVEWSL